MSEITSAEARAALHDTRRILQLPRLTVAGQSYRVDGAAGETLRTDYLQVLDAAIQKLGLGAHTKIANNAVAKALRDRTMAEVTKDPMADGLKNRASHVALVGSGVSIEDSGRENGLSVNARKRVIILGRHSSLGLGKYYSAITDATEAELPSRQINGLNLRYGPTVRIENPIIFDQVEGNVLAPDVVQFVTGVEEPDFTWYVAYPDA